MEKLYRPWVSEGIGLILQKNWFFSCENAQQQIFCHSSLCNRQESGLMDFLQFFTNLWWIWNLQIILLIILGAFTTYLVWLIFCKPFNHYRDFTEYGYEQLTEQLTKNGVTSNAAKRSLINEYKRRKKLGDVPPPYPNGWFAILESDDLPPETAKGVDALGLNLVAWRGKSGQCYVADAYCPHLGAHLGFGGKVKTECIQCPFHGWEFEGREGKVTHIPYSDSALPQFAKLETYSTVERYGSVYLWYHAEKVAPTWYPDTVPEVESGVWKYRGRTEYRIAFHLQDIHENGVDVAHMPMLHTSFVTGGPIPEKSLFEWPFIKHGWSDLKWVANEDLERQYEAIVTGRHYFNLFGKYRLFEVPLCVHQAGPGIMILKFDTVLGQGLLVQNITPVEPMMQRVVHRIYLSLKFAQPLGTLLLSVHGAHIARDIRVWNHKTFLHRPLLTKEEQAIKQFRRWYSQFYSENSVKFEIGSTTSGKGLDY